MLLYGNCCWDNILVLCVNDELDASLTHSHTLFLDMVHWLVVLLYCNCCWDNILVMFVDDEFNPSLVYRLVTLDIPITCLWMCCIWLELMVFRWLPGFVLEIFGTC
ncbi:unnamed protein product [Ilex paraguariensis]|uniref:Uncharacterized protein n=1 Tax=Ilex paraguariensis TaxID=185542 RepID=A0ABC8RRK3_9AQUA